MTQYPSRRRLGVGLVVALLGAVALAACGGDDDDGAGGASTTSVVPPAEVTLMTRNLYLGADLVPLFEATADTLGPTLQATYQQVIDSEVEARMAAVADEIATTLPDLVALQEASLWRTQAPGATEPTVLYDFLQLLLDRLTALGEPYSVAASADGFSGGLPVEGVGTVTMQDRDVILVRDASDLSVTNASHGTFDARMTIDVVGASIEVLRGWASIEATVDGETFLVTATHLEAFDDPTRDAQQAELLAVLDDAGLPVVVLGDLNSAAAGPGDEAYRNMLGAGFEDPWSQVAPTGAGATCCREADLLGGELTQRIDFVLSRGAFEAVDAEIVGTDAAARTAGGRWPSDHAGVVTTFAIAG